MDGLKSLAPTTLKPTEGLAAIKIEEIKQDQEVPEMGNLPDSSRPGLQPIGHYPI